MVRKKAPTKPASSAAGVPGPTPALEPVPIGRAPPVHRAFPVVGIGASAGGLEAFKQLLGALPLDTGMAFVLVSHLSPTHDSMLAEILGRSTELPVTEVRDEPSIEPNHVYVIPPDRGMIITDGTLKLLPRQQARGQNRPIDQFLQSLAVDSFHQAIGVILSGTASDGTLGIEALKAHGGITFAQDSSAQYDGMPRSAIASGCVDFVLPPAEIASEIARIAKHPHIAAVPAVELERSTESGIVRVLELCAQRTGVDFTHYKRNTLYRRITRRMVVHKKQTLEEYSQLLEGDPAEVDALYQDILIGVTSFFRDPEAFEALTTDVFPRLTAGRNRQDPLRVWVVGCSTGEEAYSIAICFAEFADRTRLHCSMQIFATDLNPTAIDKARIGTYPRTIAQGVSPERLRRFFTEVDGSYRIAKSIRDMCVFAQHNGLTDPSFSRMDLISCRNLLIYLDPILQQRMMPVLHYALKPDGVLWLGHSETIGTFGDTFELDDVKHKLYRRKPTPARLTRPPLHFFGARRARAQHHHVSPHEATTPARNTHRDADRVLLDRYSPPSVLVNSEFDILRFHGDTGAYLTPTPGKASFNLLKMLRKGLVAGVRGAINTAKRKTAGSVRETGLRVRTESGDRLVNVEVMVLNGPTAAEDCFLIVFETPGSPGARAAQAETPPPPAVGGDAPLEAGPVTEELASTKEYLRLMTGQHEAANEELQLAHEEVQSSNEELQSINEELETSKEEIESSNEELVTVNAELEQGNLDLARSNDDLVNLLSSVQMAIVMLDPNLRIRRFTPMAEQMLNLISTDVGRPISDIRLNVDVPDLESLLREVIETAIPQEREAQDRQGRWHSVRLRPYRTLDNRIEGAVVVLVDVDGLKQAEAAERRSAERLRIVQDWAPIGICESDFTGRFLRVNDYFCRLTGYSRDELLTRRFQDIAHPDDADAVAVEVRQSDPATATGLRVERRYRHKDGHVLWVETHRSIVTDAAGLEQFNVTTVRDISARRVADEALRESEARFRVLADSAPVLIWVHDAEGCRYVNRAYLEFLGVAQSEVTGMGWANFIHPDDRELYLAAYRDAIQRQVPFEMQFRFRSAGGEYRWMKSLGMPRSSTPGESLGCAGSTFEITDLREAVAALRQVDRRKDEFLATLAHELRNPLAPLQNLAYLLKSPGLESGQVAWIQGVLERQVTTLTRLVDDLLDVSRITHGKFALQTAEVNLAAVIRQAIETAELFLTARRQRLHLTLSSEPVWIDGDSVRLEQAFGNLLHNASKFSSDGGSIWIDLARRETAAGVPWVDVMVRDEGSGIPAEVLPQVFELFVQGDHSPQRVHSGLGIGLTLVRSLIELHGGEVNAASEGLGRGSQFTIGLPVSRRAATGTDGATEVPVPPPGVSDRPAVLIVDDSDDGRTTLALLLDRGSFDVQTASDAQSALALIERAPPRAVLLDIGLPVVDGYQFALQLRQRYASAEMTLIAMTGYGSEDARRRSREAGFDYHLTKPVDVDALQALLNALSR